MSFIKLMYITNNIEVAKIAENSGVDRIFVDMEYIGKSLRQGGMDTVQSHHTTEDVRRIKSILKKAELMVRCNPIHDATSEYSSSKEEIDAVVDSGADIIMLPYFKTADEVKTFIELVDGRAKTFPLVETKEAVEELDKILELEGIDEIYIGLNDLSLSYGKKFMFQILAEGKVDNISKKFNEKGIQFGFGGIAAIGSGMLPAEKILAEHYRLGSSSVILSRSFCNTNTITDLKEIETLFSQNVEKIRQQEAILATKDNIFFEENKEEVKQIVDKIVN